MICHWLPHKLIESGRGLSINQSVEHKTYSTVWLFKPREKEYKTTCGQCNNVRSCKICLVRKGKSVWKVNESIMIRISWLLFVTLLLLFCSEDVTGRRGRSRARSKSRVISLFQSNCTLRIEIHSKHFSFYSDANRSTDYRQIQRSRVWSILQQQWCNYSYLNCFLEMD